MNLSLPSFKIPGAAGLAIALGFATLSASALAASPNPTAATEASPASSSKPAQVLRTIVQPAAIVKAEAAALKLDSQTLRSDLKNGQTLRQIAAAENIGISTVQQAVIAAIRPQLDEAATKGTITAGQEQKIIDRINSPTFGTKTHAGPPKLSMLLQRGTIIGAEAQALQLDVKTLRTDLRLGQTLQQVALSQGVPFSSVQQAVVEAVQPQLDKAVSSQKLSAKQEQKVLDRINSSAFGSKAHAHPATRPSPVARPATATGA